VIRIDPGVVALLAELRDHERQAAEELGQCAEVDVPAKRVPNFRLSRELRALVNGHRDCKRTREERPRSDPGSAPDG